MEWTMERGVSPFSTLDPGALPSLFSSWVPTGPELSVCFGGSDFVMFVGKSADWD